MKRMISVLMAVLLCCGAALAEEEVLLEQMFLYRICQNPEIAQQPGFDETDLVWEQPPENAEYQAHVMSCAQPLNVVQKQNGLRFTALRGIAVNDLYALEWTVENISGEPRQLGEDWLLVNGENAGYNVHSLHGALLQPGEKRKGAAVVRRPGLDEGIATLSIVYHEYAADETAVDRSHLAGTVVAADEAQTAPQEYLCSDAFAVELPRSEEPLVVSVSEPMEVAWNNSVIRVESAELSVSGGSFSMLRIFETEEEALAVHPWSWDFQLLDDEDERSSVWIRVGGGTLDDEPFQLEDGRYAYRVTKTADFLNYLPEQLSVVPCAEDSESGAYIPDWDSTIEIPVVADAQPEAPLG